MRLVGVILQSRRSGVEAVDKAFQKCSSPSHIQDFPLSVDMHERRMAPATRRIQLERIMRISEVIQVTGLSKTTIWRRVKDEDFPAPVRLGRLATRSVGWRESEVKGWLGSRPTL